MKVLAKELNVSIATVSKALNDSYEISEQMKSRVREAALRLNYTLNPYASSLRNKKSKTIAVILPEITDSFFSLAINGIQSIAEKKGYHVLIYLSHEKFANEIAIVSECTSGRVDGVLISIASETTNPDHLLKLQEENIPIVFFDREFEGLDIASVTTNDFESGYLAASHLIAIGCEKPIFLSISSSLGICTKRAEGFKVALQEMNFEFKYDPIFICNGNELEQYNQVQNLLTGIHRPDGIVASVEKLIKIIYTISYEIRLSIPTELKVLIFSTLDYAPILNPPLSTISQPAFEIGKTAADLLFKRIEKKDYNISDNKIVIPSVLVKRGSSS
ncbi:LacI family transcriptional regulator [Arcticibacter svalbardensis MN12-7]|uniref:LacI family transcriptional regulator n=1 Tax=Arcticibacter svalbardensis MN12-7 TaxID=1150600 RepID=R9GUK3_9SPHI|nr:LacI family DNA-binding transcriptional regulator [Arcticibacter svalbardensis]EOR92594.1 LacI family transcriptional regulator [Arcticibacter svalbardensis MN12-7]